MPVRYDIAAQVPQASGGMDPMNAFATMQAMSYRQNQNALAQMQMQEYARKLQAEQALRGLAAGGNFNIADPRIVSQAFALDPEEGIKLANLQRQLEALQASTAAQRATADYHTGMLGVAQAKLPMEQQKLQQEALKEERLAGAAKLTGEKTALERDAELLKNAENQAAKILMANGNGYDKFYAGLHDNLKAILPPKYDEQALDKFTTQMATVQEQLKRRDEYELVDQIDPETGLKRKVAVPKYAPEKGAKPVAGTAGQVQDKFVFMPGVEGTGTVIRTDPIRGTAAVVTPQQPGAAPAPAPAATRTAMATPPAVSPPIAVPAPSRLIPSEIRPTEDAPLGSAAYNNKRFATEVLDATGFNAETGEDEVSKLIKKSTSGGLETRASGIRGFFGGTTPGMEAVARLRPIVKDIILKKMNGKLGAGISNEDRQFIEATLGNLDDPNIPAAQRLASWDSAKRIFMKYANTGAGASSAPAAGNRPSLDEIFK